jgi:uncharacterized membrane protein (UPF0127 family)
MIGWAPTTLLMDTDGGRGKRIVLSAALDETNRTVVAERVMRADTFLTRLIGLLGRDGLMEDEALWISPCKGIHTIGMSFAIDVIFLDDDLKVVALREQIAPWRATRFFKAATSVLELPAGSIRRSGVAVGDQIGFTQPPDQITTLPDKDGHEEQR